MGVIDNYKKLKGKESKYDSDMDPIEKWIENHKLFMMLILQELRRQEQQEAERMGKAIVKEVEDELKVLCR